MIGFITVIGDSYSWFYPITNSLLVPPGLKLLGGHDSSGKKENRAGILRIAEGKPDDPYIRGGSIGRDHRVWDW